MRKYTKDELSKLTVHQKLAEARIRFLESGAKKSGVNTHAEFTYFELKDIVPAASKIFDDLGLLFVTTFTDGKARGILFNTDREAEATEVTFPTRSIAEPAKFRMNEVQGLGAEITYMRRYLYMLILDIVEADEIDAADLPGEEKPPEPAKKPAKTSRPAAADERSVITANLTAPDEPASELQINGLRSALSELLKAAPEQEDFIQTVMEKTDCLRQVTKKQCEELIQGVSEMLEEIKGSGDGVA